MTYPRELPKCSEEFILELSSLVMMEFVRKPKTRYKVIVNPLCCCSPRFIFGWVDLCEPCEMVDHHQNALIAPFAFLKM